MKVAVHFQEEQLEIEIPEDRLVGEWHGPPGSSPSEVERLVTDALETPRDYPALRQAVVPGDQVVIAFDAEVPHAEAVLGATSRVLLDSGVEAGAITVLVPSIARRDPASAIPAGATLAVHDPDDRAGLAYLATTKGDRRVYLNRLATDADFVLPIGRLAYDRVLGYRGPWSTLFPGLSDLPATRSLSALASDIPPRRDRPSAALTESSEVSWLLGSQFHIGLVSGTSGPCEVVAGLESSVRDEGMAAVDRAWTFQSETRADLVLVGIGQSGMSTGIDELVEGLATATRLVRRGGKIVALSRAGGTIGPAVQRLVGLDDPRAGASALRGHESDPDYAIAKQLTHSLAWADVYLLSALDRDVVEDLGMIPLDRPEEARRLVASSASCLVVSHAELTRPDVADES